jgi:hypothetical protein
VYLFLHSPWCLCLRRHSWLGLPGTRLPSLSLHLLPGVGFACSSRSRSRRPSRPLGSYGFGDLVFDSQVILLIALIINI